MRVTLAAVGRIRSGPEAELARDYLHRFDRTGRRLGLGPSNVIEVEDRKHGGPPREAELLTSAAPKGALTIALDERGRVLSSPDFAERLQAWADTGNQDACFFIGGADGLDRHLADSADFSLSFGRMVWPHMLVRVMLCEQLYRAASILSGSPYHRV